ncbi:hypothetical protein ILUMI_25342 [Ignelater luminosus]|uniref:Daxx histone-binding domain-containing protein n=1 Tax=Ignelater luminosus TaxID=2038154 RepID=A0A8K0G011_IGNLU|nr:hypothetical protein ILUMI_25342 [Ignelater luminosus]
MAGDADIITLSSDDEEQAPPRKRVKLITIDTNIKQPSLRTFLKPESYIVLSDEEDDKIQGKNSTAINPTSAEDVKSEIVIKTPDKEITTNKTGNSTDEIQTNSIINIDEDEVMSPQDNLILNTDDKNVQDTSEPVIINDTSLHTTTEDSIEINPLSNDNESDEDAAIEEVDKNAEEFFMFLDDCLQSFTDPDHKALLHSKLPVIKTYFKKVKHYSYNQEEFLEIIRSSSKKISTNPKQIILCFGEVYQWLKSSYLNFKKEQFDIVKNRRIIKRYDKALIGIRRKLRELENAEIDWDDEEDSVYIQYERYSARAVKIYEQLCKYTDENPHQGRLIYLKLDFSHSQYPEINRAINKKYKNNREFPTYFELDKLIRKCVKEHNLNISENLLQYEIKQCFEKLGKLLQSRRKLDSYQFLQDFLDDSNDPAKDNTELNDQIKANQSTYSKKLDEVFEKYSKLQETGYEPNLSSDSDDSHYDESNSEEITNNSEEKTEEVTNNSEKKTEDVTNNCEEKTEEVTNNSEKKPEEITNNFEKKIEEITNNSEEKTEEVTNNSEKKN